jgi:hypothetical protein
MVTTRSTQGKFQPVRRSSVLMLALALSAGARAAPFCLQTQAVEPQCIYYDADSCRKEAQRQGGLCSANAKEVKLTPNVGQYCVVTSQRVSQCTYLDRTSCTAEAIRQHGACTYAPRVAPSGAPDLYKTVE